MTKCAVLIVAAGRGHRFGGELPKQYRTVGGRMILSRVLGIFCAHPAVTSVRAVIHPDDSALYRCAADGLPVEDPVFGGPTRQDSVRNGLESLKAENPDIVLIHDGARPFVDFGVINRAIDVALTGKGAIPALPVTDTVKTVKDVNGEKVVDATIDRSALWRVQTPQAFPYAQIAAAHDACKDMELTDDAAVAERAGMTVVLTRGSEDNFKITTAADLERAEMILNGKGADIRTATGFDVHRFCAGDHCRLCGVDVPHDSGLEGHSDADVGLHALTDALLGAIGSGDIGLHFPPSDMKWKGADSTIFLKHALSLVKGMGGTVKSVDVTFICERPKIGAYRLAMTEKLAELLGISSSKISIKATTTERLGFTGRKEGIAAQACATVEF